MAGCRILGILHYRQSMISSRDIVSHIEVGVVGAASGIGQHLTAVRLCPVEPRRSYTISEEYPDVHATKELTNIRKYGISTHVTPKDISLVLVEQGLHLRLHDILQKIFHLDISCVRLILAGIIRVPTDNQNC